MNDKLVLTKFIPFNVEEVFSAWTDPELLEQWSYPVGMQLAVEQLEPIVGGNFRFKHSGKEGDYIATGTFKEFIPNKKIVNTCRVTGREGKVLFDQLIESVEFSEELGGTEIMVTQEGFTDAEEAQACEQGWKESLDNLVKFLGATMGKKPGPHETQEKPTSV